MKIIDLLNDIANNKPVPRAIRCFLHEGDNDVFIYLENEQEYYNGYGFMRFPNHHLNDEIEILDKEYIKEQRGHKKNLLNKLKGR